MKTRDAAAWAQPAQKSAAPPPTSAERRATWMSIRRHSARRTSVAAHPIMKDGARSAQRLACRHDACAAVAREAAASASQGTFSGLPSAAVRHVRVHLWIRQEHSH